MKKTKLSVTAKEFERKHKVLNHNDFMEYLLSLKMDFWQYIKLKEDFIKIYREESPNNKTYSLVSHLCNVCKRIEIEKYSKELQEMLESLSLENKLAKLENELATVKTEWGKFVPDSIRSLDLVSTYSNLGVDETYEEPIEYYREIADYLKAQIEFVKNEILIENTRIIDNLYHSLRNFYYEDWTKKALKEAPNELEERLAYFIRINTDLKKIMEFEKERKPKANYFELTRFAKFNDKGDITDAPTSNYERYIDWSSTQIDLEKTKLITEINKVPAKTTGSKNIEIENEKKKFILKLLEDLSITSNGRYALSEKRKGAIRGVSEALKENQILPERSLESLNNFIAKEIGLTINSKLDFSGVSEKYRKLASKYILENHNKKQTL